MDMRFTITLAAGIAWLPAMPGFAQDVPPDLEDIVGARGSSAETVMEARGYRHVGTQTSNDSKYSTWWNPQRRQCVMVRTYDGRYASIVTTLPADCNEELSAGYDEQEPVLNLICYGEGEKPGYDVKTGYRWDRDKHRYVRETRTEWEPQEFDTFVTLQFEGDHGRIRPAKKLIPPIHSGGDRGWWTLSDVTMTRDRITARYRYNGLNKPRITIDRRTGHITVKGMTDFVGTCDNVDEDNRRF